LDLNKTISTFKDSFANDFGDSTKDSDALMYEPDTSNEDDYIDKKEDYLFTPSYETELVSSLPIICFELTYSGYVDTIKIGIGLDDNIFQIVRKILRQVFPVLDQENYSGLISDQYGNTNLDNNSSIHSGETVTTRNVIYHDDDD
jgi:hypothetical protein